MLGLLALSLCTFTAPADPAADPASRVVRYQQSEALGYRDLPVKFHLLLFAEEGPRETALLKRELSVSASRNSDRLVHFFVPETETIPAKYFGLTVEDFPSFWIYNNERDEKFRLEGIELGDGVEHITAAHLDTFTDDFFEGRVPLYIKSQAVPPGNADAAVKTLVARDLAAQIHADTAQSVIAMFYKETCPYSEEFAPTFEELGKIVAASANPHLLVAKANVDRNEFRWTNFRLARFPTVYLFKAGAKEAPIDMQEHAEENEYDRDLKGLIRFLSTHGITLSARAQDEL